MHNYTVPEKKYTLEWRTFRTPKTRSIRWRLCTTASVGSRILLVRSWIYCYSKGACLGIPLGIPFISTIKNQKPLSLLRSVWVGAVFTTTVYIYIYTPYAVNAFWSHLHILCWMKPVETQVNRIQSALHSTAPHQCSSTSEWHAGFWV